MTSNHKAGKETFGELVRARRIKLGFTLRSFCHESGCDPAYLSRIERGLVPPPQDEASLGEFAQLLGLSPGTDEWTNFHDLAAVAAGRIPADVRSDEEMVAKLPLLFRTIRGQRLTEEQLRELIEHLRDQ